MAQRLRLSRRDFLKISALAGGGLLLGVHLPSSGRLAEAAGDAVFAPNVFLRIGTDGAIIVEVARSEMGQGVMTALPMLIAEELDVGLDQLSARFAPADTAYVNRLIGQQLTGGSTSVRDAWVVLREAGAVAREMLVATAAEQWGVPPGECRTERAQVIHGASGRRTGYGELAAAAASQPVPESVFLKDPEEWRLIGTRAPRLDVPEKVSGQARFGLDVRLPGMLFASVERCPVFGGRLLRVDDAKARAVSGVVDVVPVTAGIAVVAKDTWSAFQGRKALAVDWDFAGNETLDSAAIRRRFEARLAERGVPVREEGDAPKALSGAAKTVEAIYEAPFQAHACMEPMNATADVRADGCDVYVPTQAQTRTQQVAMTITGLPEERVRVHTTYLGGGFGRRGEADFVLDAVELSKHLGRPVQVVWTREDDIRHCFYRPATLNRLRGGIDAAGSPIAWEHQIVGPSILARVAPAAVKDGVDRTSVEGAANLPYAIPNIQVDYSLAGTQVPVGFWRSVGSSQNAWVTECFLDELAAAAGRDPFELRRALLEGSPRHLRVLELAADKAGWGKPLPAGRHRGIAVAESFAGFVAQVAEVSVGEDGQVRVHRVVCAVDVGPVINPDTVEAQMEGGIVFGLTATLKGAVTIEAGRVVQGNFHDFPLLRIDEMPLIEVHIARSDDPIGGVGEPGTPPIAPAVCNAVYAATGTPVRALPIALGPRKAGAEKAPAAQPMA
ncbi:MAG: xanthine dehydrogenase family protein molybdopterin-binding subunit [Chromatiaceae bacterium]|jgi:isoquinoline 1-oxidoreductase beta subunit|nr:xanthine dehydrogenase family protein molybdopterin-binding subunit [Chromatiaceae bacterium]